MRRAASPHSRARARLSRRHRSAACRSARAAFSTRRTSRCCSRSTRLPFPGRRARASRRSRRSMQPAGEGAVAALIVEPLILGAGGMLIYSAAVLAEMKRVCAAPRRPVHRRRGDDGLGPHRARCSPASRPASRPTSPATREGLTGGALPLAVTLCTRRHLRRALILRPQPTFFHSSSYTANPIACAAAVANLEVWAREPAVDRVAALAVGQAQRLARIRNVTGASRMSAGSAPSQHSTSTFAMPAISPTLGRGSTSSSWSAASCLRPLGNTIYVMPPYCIADAELDLIYDAIRAAADALA